MNSISHTLLDTLLSYLLNSLWQTPLLFAGAIAMAYALRGQRAVVLHRLWATTLLAEISLPVLCAVWARSGAARDVGSSGGVTVSFGPGSAASAGTSTTLLWGGLALYAGTLVYFTARLLWGWRTGTRACQSASPARLDAAQQAIWQRCRERFQVPAAWLQTAPGVDTPFTWGTCRQRVVLPLGLLERVSAPELETLLAHECAHMQRQDFALNLLYELLSLPLAFHPLVHGRERACEKAGSGCAMQPRRRQQVDPLPMRGLFSGWLRCFYPRSPPPFPTPSVFSMPTHLKGDLCT